MTLVDGRCGWAAGSELYAAYHDHEWGMPVVDDRRLFEKLSLEGFQSGLSWLTILRKREGFRAAFAGFDPEVVAGFGPADVERLVADAGIVRHRGKIESVIRNARRYLALRDEGTTLAGLVWAHEAAAPGEPVVRPTSPESVALAKALKLRGWTFVGPTTVYAFLQSMGVVNDHEPGCSARERCDAARRALVRPTFSGDATLPGAAPVRPGRAASPPPGS